jgi:hypothetical protein
MKYLIQADGKLVNLALMRLGTYFRERGIETTLIRGARQRDMFDPPGEAFASSIFSFSTKARALIDQSWRPRWGGTGVRIDSSLNEIDSSVDWDRLKLDYSLYPEEARSFGMTHRGCRRGCDFCVVPEKEGKPRSTSTILDIWRGPGHAKKVVLLDNDFFGQPRDQWEARIAELREFSIKMCMSQGFVIRDIEEDQAAALASVEYRDNEFKTRTLYTAWDNIGDERPFKRGVETLRRAGIPPKHLRVYMLIGYLKSETWERILYRFNELVALGCQPYPMVYDPQRKDLKQFQRWAITGLYRAVKWEDYNPHIKRDRAAARRALNVLS